MTSAVFAGLMRARHAKQSAIAPPVDPQTASPDTPRDCVCEFPTLSPDTIQLVSFDWEGIARFRSEVPRTEDLPSWHVLLLRRTRRLYPRRYLELMG